MARAIGIKNLHYALLKADETGKVTYQPPVKVDKLINFGTENNYTDYTFYSDDIIEESGEALQSESITMELGYLSNKVKADLTGNEYIEDRGLYVTKANIVQPAMALLYEISLSDGSSDYRVLYNCKLKITEQKNQTQADDIESANVSIEGIAIPSKELLAFDMVVSTADKSADPDVISKFFTEVQVPTPPTPPEGGQTKSKKK